MTAMQELHRLQCKRCTNCNATAAQASAVARRCEQFGTELASWYELKVHIRYSIPVNKDDGQNGGAHVDGTHNGSVKESRVGTVTQDVKQFSGVEHDSVDAGELLEEGDQDSSSLHCKARGHQPNVPNPSLHVR